jgi:Fur family peroxide stress response transcriptional regulator
MAHTQSPLIAAFRARGRRITPQRALVCRLVDELKDEHPSVETLHVRAAREMPSMSLRTVYAILKELETLQAVRPLDLGTGSVRYCANPLLHHHIVCTRCGKTKDVYVDVGPLEIPPDQRRGFTIKTHEVVFRGVCTQCR